MPILINANKQNKNKQRQKKEPLQKKTQCAKFLVFLLPGKEQQRLTMRAFFSSGSRLSMASDSLPACGEQGGERHAPPAWTQQRSPAAPAARRGPGLTVSSAVARGSASSTSPVKSSSCLRTVSSSAMAGRQARSLQQPKQEEERRKKKRKTTHQGLQHGPQL